MHKSSPPPDYRSGRGRVNSVEHCRKVGCERFRKQMSLCDRFIILLLSIVQRLIYHGRWQPSPENVNVTSLYGVIIADEIDSCPPVLHELKQSAEHRMEGIFDRT